MNRVKLDSISEPIFGITARRYRQMAKEGAVPEPEKGLVDPLEAARAIIAYYRKLAEGSGDASLTDERRELVRVQRKLKELELMVAKGKLVQRDEAEGWAIQLAMEARQSFVHLPRRMAGELFGKEPRDIEEILRKEIYIILKKLSQEK